MAIAIDKLTLLDLKERFGLVADANPEFFPEWQGEVPILTSEERSRLERVRLAYENFNQRSLSEKTVELVVLAPLLEMAGFFLPPFYIETEKPVEIECDSDREVIRGRLDVLVLRDRLWVLAIESKRADFSLRVGIPQILSYMLAAQTANSVRFGMVTNGESFVFLKLVAGSFPRYGKSKVFLLGQDAGLERTLGVMRRLGEIVGTGAIE